MVGLRYPSAMATSTVEDYLKAILLQQGEGGDLVSMGAVAGALDVAPGTVTSMVKTLSDSDLVVYEPYSGVRLTHAGRQLATHVLRRHRLIELFLVRVMRIDWSLVHPEAEHLEHAVSDLLIERMDEMLGYPSTDPHGDPIPTAHGEVEETDHQNLVTCDVEAKLSVARITDQSEGFLRLMERHCLTPGQLLVVRSRSEDADTVELAVEGGGDLQLGFRAASKILVTAL